MPELTSKNDNQIHEAALRLLRKVLPSLDMLAEVWRFLRILWENSTSVGMYEVLRHEATLELKNASGEIALLSKSQQVRYLQNNIIAYQDQAWGDGDILLNYQCSPGVAVDKYKPAETTYILISLQDSRQKGDIDNFEISWRAKGAFTRDREGWVTTVSHRTKHLQLAVIFPEEKPPLNVKMTAQLSNKVFEIDTDNIVKLADGRWKISCEINKPKLYERYFIEWDW